MKDRISALMDGELEDRAAAELINTLGQGGEALDAWHTYHVIGDAMRETGPLSAGFTARLAARLAEEVTVLAPGRSPAESRKWFALSAAASLAAVAFVGWLALAPQPELARVAQAPSAPPPLVQIKPALVPLPSATNDYLLAHQGFSPRMSIQGLTPYARTVSDQVNEPRK